LLSVLEKRVLRLVAEEYKLRHAAELDPTGFEWSRIGDLLNTGHLDLLLQGLTALPASLKGRLAGVFNHLEGTVTDESDGAYFGADERRTAYQFLILISDVTVPEE